MKTIVIVGASRGIGEAIAKNFAKQQCNLILTGRSEKLNEVAQSCVKDCKVSTVFMDMTKQDDVEKGCLEILEKSNQQIDVFIQCAGIAGYSTYDLTDKAMDIIVLQEWLSIMQVNLVAAMTITKKMLPSMKKGSSMIFLGSDLGFKAIPQAEAYCGSKFGLRGFCASLFESVRNLGIRVCLIEPGPVNTEMMQKRAKLDYDKLIQPQDVANTVMFILSLPENVCPVEIVLQPQINPFK